MHYKHSFYKNNVNKFRVCAVIETFDNNEFKKMFKNFNITTTKQDLYEFVDIND